MGFFNKLFGGQKKGEQQDVPISQEEYDKDYELKTAGLENVLGPMHEMVGHAIIPFSLGGAVDMYYFPGHIKGTGFATMELLDLSGKGPLPNKLGTYELVAFTRYPMNENDEKTTIYNLIERRLCGILTTVGNYSMQAVLNPLETCEIPITEKEYGCLVFDNYKPNGKAFSIGTRNHHLLLCLEVFRTEMEYAREHGSNALITLLKNKGYYPYSDLDREPVI